MFEKLNRSSRADKGYYAPGGHLRVWLNTERFGGEDCAPEGFKSQGGHHSTFVQDSVSLVHTTLLKKTLYFPVRKEKKNNVRFIFSFFAG